MAEDAGPSVRFLKWCGLALVAAGVLMVVATLLHPSRETASTIVLGFDSTLIEPTDAHRHSYAYIGATPHNSRRDALPCCGGGDRTHHR